MNRLWVWISGVILGVVLIVAFFPFVSRSIARTAGSPPRPAEPFPKDDVEAFRAQIEKRIWLDMSKTIAVGAIGGLIAGIFLTRWLVAPLQHLEKGAEAIAQRKLDYRVPVQGSEEMRSVAKSFNQMASELERQETLRRNMLADVTHELRHPIHILQGSLQAILDGVYPLSMQEIDRMLEQTQNLTALVNDLYELALAEGHELLISKEKTDLTEVVKNIVDTIQPLASQQSIKLTAKFPSLPVYNKIDIVRFRQVMQNLLGNALRYTPEGGEITVSVNRLGRYDKVVVADSGIGIGLENLSRVFERFYRQDQNRDRNLPGAGLGLAIAQAIIQAHGGRIEVESAGINQGSAFTLWLPAETSEAGAIG